MKWTWMATGLLVASSLLVPQAEAQAGTRVGVVISASWDGHGYHGRDTYRIGYQRGYEDGLDRGRQDADRRNDFNMWRDRNYRNGDAGYHSGHGQRGEYASGYRNGYEQGYRQGYRQERRFRRGDEWRKDDDRRW